MSKTTFLTAALWSLAAWSSEPVEGEHATVDAHHEGATHEGVEHHEEAEPLLEYSVDFAVGFTDLETFSGTNEVIALEPAGAPARAPKQVPTFEKSRVWTTSLLLGVEHATPHATFGLRLPILMGGITALEGEKTSRTVAPLLGNLELEASHHTELAEGLSLEWTMEVALPTAMGEEAPLPGEAIEGEADAAAIARGEVLRAAEFARGSLDSTLFEPGRAGFIPKLSLDYRVGGFHLRPTVKFEMLFDTRGRAAEHLIGELVAGVRVSYEFAHVFEPYVHAWTNITVTEHAERNVDVLLFEPGVKFRFGKLRPQVGVVLPAFGRLVDDKTLGVRVALTGEL
jgi:hypothetical protein